MRRWSRLDAELHGYVHPCPVCGRVEDTPGPCSQDCEDRLARWEDERGVPYCADDGEIGDD